MFGLGFWEIAVVVLLAVMLFPPKELPKLARSVARTYGSLKRTAEDFRNTVMHDEELREPLDEIRGAYNDARWQVRDVERQARVELAKARTEARIAARQAADPPSGVRRDEPQLAVGDLDDDDHHGHDDHDDIDADAFYAQAREPMEGERSDGPAAASGPVPAAAPDFRPTPAVEADADAPGSEEGAA